MDINSGNIEKQINKHIPKLNSKQKKIVLHVVKAFANEKKDWWDDLSSEQITAIKEAESELEAGLGVPHEEAFKKYSKWL